MAGRIKGITVEIGLFAKRNCTPFQIHIVSKVGCSYDAGNRT